MRKVFKFGEYIIIDGIDNSTKDFSVSSVYIWRDIKDKPERYKEIAENLPQILLENNFDLNSNEIYILKLRKY